VSENEPTRDEKQRGGGKIEPTFDQIGGFSVLSDWRERDAKR